MTKQQKQTVARIKRIDPQAKTQEVEGQLFVTYVPGWERGRHSGGEFRPNPNPQAITFYVHSDGRQFGWGFGNESKVPVKLAMPITQKADMAEALKARAEARKPVKLEQPTAEEPTPEPTPTKAKATTKKRTTRTRKTGVKATA